MGLASGVALACRCRSGDAVDCCSGPEDVTGAQGTGLMIGITACSTERAMGQSRLLALVSSCGPALHPSELVMD